MSRLLTAAIIVVAIAAVANAQATTWISVEGASRTESQTGNHIFWHGYYSINAAYSNLVITGKYRTPPGTSYGDADSTSIYASSWDAQLMGTAAGTVGCAGEMQFTDQYGQDHTYWTDNEIEV